MNKGGSSQNTGGCRVTVLMTCYKGDNPLDLRNAITSCLTRQSEAAKVLLVVDGPIPAQLEEVIKELESKWPTLMEVYWKPKNSGLADSLNLGVSKILTPFVARLDADDLAAPDRFMRQLRFLETGDYDIVGGSILEFGSVEPRIRNFPETHLQCFLNMAKRSPLNHPSMLCKVRILQENKYSTNLYRGGKGGVSSTEDLDLWFRLMSRGFRFGNIDQVVTYHRITPSFFLRRGRDKAMMEFQIYNQGIRLLGLPRSHKIFPLIRLLVRLAPTGLKRLAYSLRPRLNLNIDPKILADLNVFEKT